MTLRRPRPLLLALVLLLLAACASSPGGRLQSAGEVQAFDLRLQSELDWARIRAPRQEAWTIDGLPLNQLRIVSRIKPGEHVFLQGRQRKSQPDGPWFRAGMRPDEIRDLVLDALRLDGWSQVAARGLRPARFGDVAGLRFELDLTDSGGLIYRGQAAAAERGGQLTLLLWLAPAEHYYPRDAEAVARMLDSLRFAP